MSTIFCYCDSSSINVQGNCSQNKLSNQFSHELKGTCIETFVLWAGFYLNVKRSIQVVWLPGSRVCCPWTHRNLFYKWYIYNVDFGSFLCFERWYVNLIIHECCKSIVLEFRFIFHIANIIIELILLDYFSVDFVINFWSCHGFADLWYSLKYWPRICVTSVLSILHQL